MQALATVQRTLGAMDEDNIRDESGRLRLRELQQFAYDAQDAIDEYKFELLRRMMDDPIQTVMVKTEVHVSASKGKKEVLAVLLPCTSIFIMIKPFDLDDCLFCIRFR